MNVNEGLKLLYKLKTKKSGLGGSSRGGGGWM